MVPFQVAELTPTLPNGGSCRVEGVNNVKQNYKFTTIPTASGGIAPIKAQTEYSVYLEVSNTEGDSVERSDFLLYTTGGSTTPGAASLDCIEDPNKVGNPKSCILPLEKMTGGSMEIAWNPPENTGGGTIVGYLLHICAIGPGVSCTLESDWKLPFKFPTEHKWKSNGGLIPSNKNLYSETDPLLNAPRQSFTLKRLISGQQYYVRVRNKNDKGSGPWSETKIYTTPSMSLPVRIASKDIIKSSNTGGTITLDWIPPDDTGGSTVDELWYHFK